MKYFFSFILLLALNEGCKPKELSGAKLEDKLIETMNDYLHKTLEPGVSFTIKNVIYYPDKKKKLYLCQFQVNVHYKTDTTGMMAATISNDFSKIERTQ